mgnify:CR=1 FL=1|tara:strand:+ start:7614 stop:8288 length:675 start_codon:yes stop_codon:yes gene_type:complete
MALSNYTELKSAIANWLNRSDLTTEIAGDFITLAEADFNAKLRIRQMHSQSTLTVNAETVAVPTGFLQVRDFYILQTTLKYPLRYVTPVQMDQLKGTSTEGLPTVYTILGDNFRFSPKPDISYSGILNFYKSFDALSDSNTTNYILTSHPAIYLYGSLFHAANFLGGVNPNQLAMWQQMYATALERLEQNDREDQFSGSPLQIRSEDTVASRFNDVSQNVVTNT